MKMRNPKDIGTDLRAWMRTKGLTEAELAEKISNNNNEINISQSWISRILNGRFRRITPAIKAIAQYANIRINEPATVDHVGADIIQRAIRDAWDGSVTHANLIARLIRVTQWLSR